MGSPELPSYLQPQPEAEESPPADAELEAEEPHKDAAPQSGAHTYNLETSDLPPPQIKRGRGRPRKYPLPSDRDQVLKRGPGRPRKQSNPQSSAAETAFPLPSSAGDASSKRGPGRPRKQPHPQAALDQQAPPLPPGSLAETPSAAAHSNATYHSDSAVEVKKRGRPPKNTASLTMLSESPASSDAGPLKKRGRPRKNPLPESSLAPYRDEEAEGLLLLLPEQPVKRGPGRPRKNPDDPSVPAKKPKKMSAANLEKWRKGLASWRTSLMKMMRDLEAAESAYQAAAAAGASGSSAE